MGPEGGLIFGQPEITSIASAAAGLVKPGAVVALTGGSTTLRLAQCLLDVPQLTIVTNSLMVAAVFTGNRGTSGVSVVLTGGVRTSPGSLAGPVADLTITSLYFSTVFLGCTGIDPQAG